MALDKTTTCCVTLRLFVAYVWRQQEQTALHPLNEGFFLGLEKCKVYHETLFILSISLVHCKVAFLF